MKIPEIFIVLCIFGAIRSIECIFGGRNASLNEFPYMVSIRESDEGGHYCGGAILNKRYIITSAMCLVIFQNPKELVALAGVTSLDAEGVKIEFEKLIKYPEFDAETLAHDIALIRTTKDIKFGKNIGAVDLPSSDLPKEGGTQATVIGWGDTDVIHFILNHSQFLTISAMFFYGAFHFPLFSQQNGPNYDNLRVLKTTTLDMKNCKIQLEANEEVVDDYSICTKNEMGTGICQYDQGYSSFNISMQITLCFMHDSVSLIQVRR